MEIIIEHFIRDEGLVGEISRLNSIVLKRLQAFEQEEARLNLDYLAILDGDLVSTIVDLAHQFCHVVAVEWRLSLNKLVQNTAKSPSVHCVVVEFSLEDLG